MLRLRFPVQIKPHAPVETPCSCGNHAHHASFRFQRISTFWCISNSSFDPSIQKLEKLPGNLQLGCPAIWMWTSHAMSYLCPSAWVLLFLLFFHSTFSMVFRSGVRKSGKNIGTRETGPHFNPSSYVWEKQPVRDYFILLFTTHCLQKREEETFNFIWDTNQYQNQVPNMLIVIPQADWKHHLITVAFCSTN